MEQLGLLSFPTEMLHYLSQFLSPKDVLNLSQTCHSVRAAFNDDAVWRRYVSEKIAYLKSKDSVVEPLFILGPSLSPLCEKRIEFSKRSHLLRNWRRSNFLKCSSDTVVYLDSQCTHSIPKGRSQIIYKDRYIFTGRSTDDVRSDGIQVWDVNRTPVLHTFLPVDNLYYKFFYIFGNKLVVVECRRVNVYQISNSVKDFLLLYSFIITEVDVYFDGLAIHDGKCDVRCFGWSHYNVGQYLVSNKCGDEGNVLHVWDILTNSKFGAFATPIEGFSTQVIFHKNNTLLLGQNKQNNQLRFFFNINEKTFSDTVFIYEGHAEHTIYYKSHIILFDKIENSTSSRCYDSVCIVYDFETSKEVKRRCFNNARKNNQLSFIRIMDGKFIILCFNVFQMVDALTLETVDSFNCDLDDAFITHQFNVHGSIFVVAADDNDLMHVWDVKSKKKLSRSLEIFYTSHLYLSESCSKLVTFGDYDAGLSVIHFW